jgi:hypothetical protein
VTGGRLPRRIDAAVSMGCLGLSREDASTRQEFFVLTGIGARPVTKE